MTDKPIAVLDLVAPQVERPLWCLPLEAPSPLGHLSPIPDLYLLRIFLQLYTFLL